jgi:hypothetical protein
MNHRITIDERQLNANYEKMMDEVYLLYHTHPSNLIPISLSESEIAEYSEYNAIGRGLAALAQPVPNRKKKKVYFQSDPDYCNGLPRNR